MTPGFAVFLLINSLYGVWDAVIRVRNGSSTGKSYRGFYITVSRTVVEARNPVVTSVKCTLASCTTIATFVIMSISTGRNKIFPISSPQRCPPSSCR